MTEDVRRTWTTGRWGGRRATAARRGRGAAALAATLLLVSASAAGAQERTPVPPVRGAADTTLVVHDDGADVGAARSEGSSGDAAGVGGAAAVRVPAGGALRLEASLSERRLVVWRGDTIVAEYPVAVGKPGYRTPTGSFTIRTLIWNPGWVPPESPWARGKTAKEPGDPGNPMKVVKIFFQQPDYYIHGTGALHSLGEAASHGCLRMSPAAVAELARTVMVHGGAPRDDGWFTEVLEGRATHEVTLAEPVPLVVR